MKARRPKHRLTKIEDLADSGQKHPLKPEELKLMVGGMMNIRPCSCTRCCDTDCD